MLLFEIIIIDVFCFSGVFFWFLMVDNCNDDFFFFFSGGSIFLNCLIM